MTTPVLHTERLVLRPWTPDDLEPAAAMNADPETMRFFPAPLTRQESDDYVDRMMQTFEAFGIGMWALSPQDGAEFLGAVGLLLVTEEYPFGPTVEVGWRLVRTNWGKGYATEAARAALDHAFDVRLDAQIVAMTSRLNLPSQAVMERLGMHRDPVDDFDHPRIPEGHPLCSHVLYRLGRAEWNGPPQ